MRERVDPSESEDLAFELAQEDGAHVRISVPQDPGAAGKTVAHSFARRLDGWMVTWSPETGDKVQRAEAFAPQCRRGAVYIVKGEWTSDFLDELCLFPGGRYADQVDATSRAYSELLNFGSTGVASGAIGGAANAVT